MATLQSTAGKGAQLAICMLTVLMVPWSPVRASRPIEEHRSAGPQGDVEIVNVSGSVEVDGWDRGEVDVAGTAGDNVERVDVTSAGNRTSIRVVSRSGHSWGSDGEALLVVHVPAKSSVTASLVSADLKVAGLQGDLNLQTVSGSVRGETGGNVHATTVSGDVRLTARSATNIEIRTISGGIHFTGGGGEVDISTVSGTSTIELAEVTRGRFKSISGDLAAELALGTGGQIESESVSGDVGFKFASAPAAEFDVQTISGDIDNCFGPKPTTAQYGPGSRLQFTNGEGRGRVRIATKSGDVRLCSKDAKARRQADADGRRAALAQNARSALIVPYVY